MESHPERKGIPIGISDFQKLITSNGYFVDKSLFIKEICDDISAVRLITRPRRFGKTLNLSMLRYFFEKTPEDNGRLFHNLRIWRESEQYRREQGQYPVVYLTFKDIKDPDFEKCFDNLKHVIGNEYKRHRYLLDSKLIDDYDKEQFHLIKNREASCVQYKNSLNLLTELLTTYHQKRTIVLIDEYDTPINQGYLSGYFEEIIFFMRNFLGAGLKDNPNLQTGVITGIYRVAKASIFSDFNNLDVCSITRNLFADKFGFTAGEVEELLDYYHSSHKREEVREWYKGYLFGDDTVIYNPWSILNSVKYEKLEPYWVNTSSNDLIRSILHKTEDNVKKKLQLLLEGREIENIAINTDTNFRDIQNRSVIDEDVLWSLLLVGGYLKPTGLNLTEGQMRCNLAIPNRELKVIYEETVREWFREGNVSAGQIREMLEHLVEGETECFREDFTTLVWKTFSYFDVGENGAENFYHAFILGLLVNLGEEYRVKSNPESGQGRPDLLIIPQNRTKKGVVMEFKVTGSDSDDIMAAKAREALEQIERKNYREELIQAGIKEVLELAIVFCRKKVFMESQVYSVGA